MKINIFLIFLFMTLACCRNYPLYKQCDSKWANDQLGTSAKTICQAGCLMSSASMALAGTGHNYTPKTLNQWLRGHGGYVSGDLFVWSAIDKLGLTFEGKVANSQIKSKLDAGRVVICNVHNGQHWVLAHGYSGDNIHVNDPGFSTTSYSLSQIVNGQNGIYKVTGVSQFFYSLIFQTIDPFNNLRKQKNDLMEINDRGILSNNQIPQ